MRKIVFAATSLLVLLSASGCATQGIQAGDAQQQAAQACQEWFRTLDSATEHAGVRDAAAVPVPGFVQLRADRFHAALGEGANTAPDRQNYLKAWVRSLQQLDAQARGYEIANMPSALRASLAAQAQVSNLPQAFVDHTQTCATRLTERDTQSPERMALLQQRVQVPDSYSTVYRFFGLYALTRYPFAAGVRSFEAQQQAVFDAASQAPVVDQIPNPRTSQPRQRLRLLPPESTPTAQPLHTTQITQMLTPTAQDPLRKPQPTPQELESLFAQHAPSFDLEIASEDDKPGALHWPANPALPLAIDTRSPVLYRQVAYTRYRGHSLLQLVYTLWFGARPRQSGAWVDLLAGHLDGIVFRVTLAHDGSPLVYDSMHPCGCYHFFFPTASARPKPAPQSGIEWAFSPQTVPALKPQERLVLRLEAGTHYLQHIGVETASTNATSAGRATVQSTHYSWRDYDSLRSLPLSHSSEGGASQGKTQQNSRSAFGPDGFIAVTDRLESWIFWPMGISRAGAMRQWGHHATAFVGRRHFDYAHLLEQRFDFDPRHFASPSDATAQD